MQQLGSAKKAACAHQATDKFAFGIHPEGRKNFPGLTPQSAWTSASKCTSDTETEIMSNMDSVGTISQHVLQERVPELWGEGRDLHSCCSSGLWQQFIMLLHPDN